MSGEVKAILYGRTTKVKLADGKDYILREPNLTTLDEVDLNLDDLAKTANLKKLIFLMTKEDQPEITEKEIGQLVTFRMLTGKHPLMETVLKLLGIEQDSKNGEARTQ